MDGHATGFTDGAGSVDHRIYEMPIIGRLFEAGARQKILAAIGMFMFLFFCFWGYKILTPDTGKDAFFWMLIFREWRLGSCSGYHHVVEYAERSGRSGKAHRYRDDASIG